MIDQTLRLYKAKRVALIVIPIILFLIGLKFFLSNPTIREFRTVEIIPSSDRFEDAVEYILKNEGGYVFEKDDHGGATNMGIAQSSHPNINVKDLSLDDIKKLYREEYWDKSFSKDIPNKIISIKTFDNTVLMGAKQSGIILQRAINACGERIVIDGNVGEQTFTALKKIHNIEGLLWVLRSETISFFFNLTKKDPTQQKFLLGWIARVFKTPKN